MPPFAMKTVLCLMAFFLVTVVHGSVYEHGRRHSSEPRTEGGWWQQPNGKATFTAYDGCQYPGKQR